MKHDDVADLLGAYALDAVDDDERELVERHLAECVRCRAEVHDHRETASMLAHAGGEAPAGLWDRIAGALEEEPPGLRLVPETAPAPRARHGRRPPVQWVAAAAVAAAAVVVAVLGVQLRQQDQRIDELQAALQDPLAPALQAALEDPDSRVVELASADGELVLRGAVTEEGLGYLRATDLPRLDPGRTYQLWGAAGDQLVSVGVLGPSPDVITFAAAPYAAFAITEEVAPGVVVSSQQPVVAGGFV